MQFAFRGMALTIPVCILTGETVYYLHERPVL